MYRVQILVPLGCYFQGTAWIPLLQWVTHTIEDTWEQALSVQASLHGRTRILNRDYTIPGSLTTASDYATV